ncbi:MAG: PAS domain S-box protein [Nitrospiraceae bacterium]|nr:PAS domain S-box protein [Nitrospiraceae bacterium]
MDYNLADFLDFEQMQRLLNGFCDMAGTAAAIIDLDGEILVGAHWQRICTDFHRPNAATCTKCIESDTDLANRLKAGERYSVYRCRNGLTDAASPITIAGEHVANAFVGQFLTEPADEDYFRKQAAEHGFDEKTYLEALAHVPVIHEKRLHGVLRFLQRLAEIVGTLAYNEMRRRLDAERISQSEMRYRSLVEHLPVQVFVKDTESTFVSCNQRFAQDLGIAPDEVVGKTDFDFYPTDLAEKYRADDKRVMESGQTDDFEEKHVHNGHGTYVRTIKSPLRDDTGTVTGVLGVFWDVTARRRAEEALRISEEKYRFLVENQTDMIVKFDRDFRLLFASPSYCRTFGQAQDELLGEAFDPFLSGDAGESAAQGFAEVFDPPYSCYREGRANTANGLRWQAWLSTGVLDDAGQTISVVAVGRDITSLKLAEEKRRALSARVQHAQKLESLGVLAGGIAHDFNNLLMAILGNADLALQDLSPVSPARDSINEIEQAARRAADLCRQMLAYSGKGQFFVEPIDLNEVIREMAHILEVSTSKNVALKYNHADNLPTIEGDASQIRQIVLSLATNASEAIGDVSGVVSLTTGAMECGREYLRDTSLDDDLPDGIYCYVEVSDTGCGMDKETQTKVFDPFFTTKFTGRGLGMAAAIGIVRGHRGAIKIYSEPGKGTSVKLLFPVCEQRELPRSSSPTMSKTLDEAIHRIAEGKTVLLVDDEDSVRAVGKRMLEKLGFNVLTAADGCKGIEVFMRHPNEIDCVLLDLTMPNMGGEETFQEMRGQCGDVCVVLSSGYNEQEAVSRFSGKGLAGFIQKPYQMTSLAETLRDALGTT